MQIILSPSKTIKHRVNLFEEISTQPIFKMEAEEICSQLKRFSLDELQKLLKTSPNLTQTAYDFYQHWNSTHTIKNSTQAIQAFSGDVFTGMESLHFPKETLLYSQQHLTILSALYGALRPLDIIQPYRLDVANPLKITNTTLYQYWKLKVTQTLNRQLELQKNKITINLASAEYFKMIDHKKIIGEIITPTFKDNINGSYKIVSLYAKKARGKMTKFILVNKISNSEELKTYTEDGYYFAAAHSDKYNYIFLRG